MNECSIQWFDSEALRPGPWASVYVLKPDRLLLEKSLIDYGWIQPLVVQAKTGKIIDGNVRFEVAQSIPALGRAYRNGIPAIVHQCDDVEAMLMHLRLNRSRGNIVAKKMSIVLRDVLRSGKYGESDLKKLLHMKSDELDLLIDGSLIKSRKIEKHQYSRAWVPVEAPASFTDSKAVIERPPNADR